MKKKYCLYQGKNWQEETLFCLEPKGHDDTHTMYTIQEIIDKLEKGAKETVTDIEIKWENKCKKCGTLYTGYTRCPTCRKNKKVAP